jgi:hypothetical protein
VTFAVVGDRRQTRRDEPAVRESVLAG